MRTDISSYSAAASAIQEIAHAERGPLGRALDRLSPVLGRTLAIVGAGLVAGSLIAMAMPSGASGSAVPHVSSVGAGGAPAPTATATTSSPPSPSPTPLPNTSAVAAAATFQRQTNNCGMPATFTDRVTAQIQDGQLVVVQPSQEVTVRGPIQPDGSFTLTGPNRTYTGRLQGRVLQGTHVFDNNGCRETYGFTFTLQGDLVSAGQAVPSPAGVAISSITASFSRPVTTYRISVSGFADPTRVRFTWTNTNTCGTFTPGTIQADWSHPDPPCPVEEIHPATITVVATDGAFRCTASYPNGSAPGQGPPSGTCVAATSSPSPSGSARPSGSLVPGVGVNVVSTGGGGTPGGPIGGLLAGLGLTLFGVGIVIRQRCDCTAHERAFHQAALELQRAKDWVAGLEADIAAIEAVLPGWDDYLTDLYFYAYFDLPTWEDEIHEAIDKWTAYVTALNDRLNWLKSLLGPVAIAGRDRYDTREHPGWVEVAPGFWANSEKAANAARTAAAVAEILKGGLMGLPGGGIGWVGAIQACQMAIANAQATIANLWVVHGQITAEQMRVEKEIPEVEAKIRDLTKRLEGHQQDVQNGKTFTIPQKQAEYDKAAAALAACHSGPPCGDAPVVSEYDIESVEQLAPEQPPDPTKLGPPTVTTPPEVGGPGGTGGGAPRTEERDALGGILEGFIGMGGGTPPSQTEPPPPPAPAPPTETKKQQPEVALLDDDQKKKIGTMVREREQTRQQIRELERKEHPTTEDRAKLEELREKERQQNRTISNEIATSHNSNVDKIRKTREERLNEQNTTVELKKEDVERVTTLEKEKHDLGVEISELESKAKAGTLTDAERQTLEAKKRQLGGVETKLRDAKATAVRNATVTRPKTTELTPADKQKIGDLEKERSKLDDEIRDLETKEKAGKLDDAGRKRLSLARQEREEIPGRIQDVHTQAKKDAAKRDEERKRTQGDAPKPQAAPQQPTGQTQPTVTKPDLLPEDKKRLTEKQRAIDGMAAKLLTYWKISQQRPLTDDERRAYRTLQKQHSDAVRDIAEDYTASQARATAAPPPVVRTEPKRTPADDVTEREKTRRRIEELERDPDRLTPTQWTELTRLRAREKQLDEEIARLYDRGTGRVHLSAESQAALDAANVEVDRKKAEATRLATRYRELEANKHRTPDEDRELARIQQRLMTELPSEVRDILQRLLEKHPEVREALRKQLEAEAREAAAAEKAMEDLKKQTEARITAAQDLARSWAKQKFRIDDPQHPLVQLLTVIGVKLGTDVLKPILDSMDATDPATAFAQLSLATADKLKPTESYGLLAAASQLLSTDVPVEIVAVWGRPKTDVSVLRTKVAVKLAETAVATGSLPQLIASLATLRELGLATGPRATEVQRKIREVFPTQFDAQRFLAELTAADAPVPAKALRLSATISELKGLADATQDPNIKTALATLEAAVPDLLKQLDGEIMRATRETQESGSRERAARLLLERVRSDGLKGMTKEDEALFDRLYPDWRTWVGHENFMQRTGEYAARRLEAPLEERWHGTQAATKALAERVGELEQIRLILTNAAKNGYERRTAFTQAFGRLMEQARRFDDATLGSRSEVEHAQLLVYRSRANAAQTLAFAGDTEGVRRELDEIFREMNGWDEMRDRPGYLLKERIHHTGIRERLIALDKDSTEAKHLRDRLSYLQRRRIDLMMADPSHYSYASLRFELQRDVAYWEHRKPWKELAWISGDNVSEKVYQEAVGTERVDTAFLAWQMASARRDPQEFAAFLHTLQREKIARGDKAWSTYVNEGVWERGWFSQTDKLVHHAADVANEMFEKDQQLHTALAAMTSLPVDKLPADMKAILLRNGFIATDDKGKQRYVVPSRFDWDPYSVGERQSEKDVYDHLFNLKNATQTVAIMTVGGWVGAFAKTYGLAAEAYGFWIALGSEIALETTAFMATTSFLRGGNPFSVLLGTTSYKDLAVEWLETAVTIGALKLSQPAMERIGEAVASELTAGRSAVQAATRATTVADRVSQLISQGYASGTSALLELGLMTAVTVPFKLARGESAFTTEDLLRTAYVIGLMRTWGTLTEAQANDAYRQAREYGIRIRRAQEAYERVARDVLETAKREGRTELTDHERAKLDAAKQTYADAAKFDLTREFRDIERELTKTLEVRIGEATGGWRELARDTERQRQLFDGKTLAEALATKDGTPSDAFAVRYKTAFKALVRFMHEAGSWVSVKNEIFRSDPELATALFEVRKAWADWITADSANRATVIGTVKNMTNDCDFNFALGEGTTLDPVPRMRKVAEETQRLVREALRESGVPESQAARADYQLLFESNSYTDPAILHLYTRLEGPAREQAVRLLTRDSVGVSRWMIREHFRHLPLEVRTRAVRDLDLWATAGSRTPEEIARDLGFTGPHWNSTEGREWLLAQQSRLFERYVADPTNVEVVTKICETQMLLNTMAEGAYVTPGAGLVTVTIKEGLYTKDMTMVRRQMNELKRELAGRDDATKRKLLETLEKEYEQQRLEAIKSLTPDEALQSVLGDLVFFWHMAETASHNLEAFDIVMRYEFSKYVARLVEVAKAFGMDPASMTPGDHRFTGIAKLLRTSTKIYKGKKPWEAFGEGPAFTSLTEMRQYFSSVQKAASDVVRYLLEHSSFRDRLDLKAESFGPPATPDRSTSAREDAWLSLANMTIAERELRLILGGDASYAGREHVALDFFYDQYEANLARVRKGASEEGASYWSHFSSEIDVQYLQRRLEFWRTRGTPLETREALHTRLGEDAAKTAVLEVPDFEGGKTAVLEIPDFDGSETAVLEVPDLPATAPELARLKKAAASQASALKVTSVRTDSFAVVGDDLGTFLGGMRKLRPVAGYVDVFVHGGKDAFYILRDASWVKVSAKELADALWAAGYDGRPIRLVSCETGAVDASNATLGAAADALAKILKTEIWAPNKTIWLGHDGRLFISSREPAKWTPQSKPSGVWRAFGSKPKGTP